MLEQFQWLWLMSLKLRDLQSKYDSAKLRFEYEKEASIEAINKFKIELGAEKKKVELLQGKLEVAATKIADVEDMMKTIIGYVSGLYTCIRGSLLIAAVSSREGFGFTAKLCVEDHYFSDSSYSKV